MHSHHQLIWMLTGYEETENFQAWRFLTEQIKETRDLREAGGVQGLMMHNTVWGKWQSTWSGAAIPIRF